MEAFRRLMVAEPAAVAAATTSTTSPAAAATSQTSRDWDCRSRRILQVAEDISGIAVHLDTTRRGLVKGALWMIIEHSGQERGFLGHCRVAAWFECARDCGPSTAE